MLIGIEYLKRVLYDEDYDSFINLKDVYLIDPEEKKVYKDIIDYLSKYSKLPPVSFIDSPIDVYEEHPLDYWFDRLKERYNSHILQQISAVTDSNKDKPDEIIEKILGIINNIPDDGAEDICYGDNLIEAMKDRINELRLNYLRNGLTGISTGWPTLDRLTGGYTNGDVVVFCGRPKMGKTMLLIYSANKILEMGKKVMFISMEMTKEQILQRISAVRAPVRYSAFKGIVCSFTENRIIQSLREVRDRLIVVEGHLQRSILSLNSLIVKHNPDIVFIDGAYLVQSKTRHHALWEAILSVIQDIKQLAMKNNIPIVCSYQFRRGTSKNPDLENIAFADAIGQIASIVVGVVADVTNEKKRILDVIASRDSPISSFVIKWDWDTMRFDEDKEDLNGQGEIEEDRSDYQDLPYYEEDF